MKTLQGSIALFFFGYFKACSPDDITIAATENGQIERETELWDRSIRP